MSQTTMPTQSSQATPPSMRELLSRKRYDEAYIYGMDDTRPKTADDFAAINEVITTNNSTQHSMPNLALTMYTNYFEHANASGAAETENYKSIQDQLKKAIPLLHQHLKDHPTTLDTNAMYDENLKQLETISKAFTPAQQPQTALQPTSSTAQASVETKIKLKRHYAIPAEALNPLYSFTKTEPLGEGTTKKQQDPHNAAIQSLKDTAEFKKALHLLSEVNPAAQAQRQTDVISSLCQKHNIHPDELGEFNKKIKAITDRIPNAKNPFNPPEHETLEQLADEAHHLIKKQETPPPFPMDSGKQIKADEIGLPHFTSNDGGQTYDIHVPKDFSGHVFVPRIDTKTNAKIGDDMFEYENGRIIPGKCLIEKGLGKSMMSPELKKKYHEAEQASHTHQASHGSSIA